MPIQNAQQIQDTNSILFKDTEISKYNTAMASVSEEFGGVQRSQASRYGMNYGDLMPGVSSRPGLTRGDYETFRPSEATPKKHKDVMCFAQEVYKNNGLIKEVIDLMGDFASQGVRLSSTDKREERFYRNWFKKVRGPHVTERFSNYLYRLANIVLRRQTAIISRSQRATMITEGKADLKIETVPTKKSEIPWNYIFLNPAVVDVMGGTLSNFTQDKQYVIHFPSSLANKITSVINGVVVDEKNMVKGLPPEILQAMKDGGYYKLPKDKTLVFHYKKDDWETWASPMVHAIADDILMLEKLKLADISALDGAISNIRIIKLGSLDPLILPGKGAAAKLKSALASHVGGGTVDIVWDAAIDMLESRSEVYKFLGQAKYDPTMNNIYGGLGIPQTLTGSSSAGGTTNNLISLQTLVQRLEYGRSILREFWEGEIKIVKEAMNFTTMAKLEFDYMELGDAASTRKLLIDLSDRGLISDELLKAKFQHDNELEEARIKEENKKRDAKELPQKASPFHNAEHDKDLEKIKLQNDGKLQKAATKAKGVSGQGRPKNSKDSVKRKPKKFVPKSKASLDLWIADAQERVSQVVNPAILAQFNKKNMRGLSAKEAKIAEDIKFGVLLNVDPFEELTDENIKTACSKPIDNEAHSQYLELCAATAADLNRDLTYDDTKHIQRRIYEDFC